MLLLKLEVSVLMSSTAQGVQNTTENRVETMLETHSWGAEQNPMAERLKRRRSQKSLAWVRNRKERPSCINFCVTQRGAV